MGKLNYLLYLLKISLEPGWEIDCRDVRAGIGNQAETVA